MQIPDWLYELGATRPMAPAGETVLVLGEQYEGVYPISFKAYRLPVSVNADGSRVYADFHDWHVFGVPVEGNHMTREQCERILSALKKGGERGNR